LGRATCCLVMVLDSLRRYSANCSSPRTCGERTRGRRSRGTQGGAVRSARFLPGL